jgi:Zn-dependent protease
MLSGLNGIELVMFLVSALIAMTIHEAMHGYVAYWLGDTTAADEGRLTFNPLKSIDLITTVAVPLLLILAGLQPFFAAKPVPFNPNRVKYEEYGAALVGIAGPLTNLALAVIGALVFRLYGSHAAADIYNALVIFVEVNIAFFVFNMIPIPPLDGSRLLYAFAPEGLQRIMRQIEGAGFLVIIAVVLVGFHYIAGPLGNIENHILHFLLG